MNGNLVSLDELLIGNRLFDIPVYQRSYAWESKNLEDLWEDLYYLDDAKIHFFGTLLLKDSGESTRAGTTTFKRLDVIDGQQRLTTVLILLREIISQMKDVIDKEIQNDVPKLEEDYLKPKSHYKLNLMGDDAKFFTDFVIDDNEHPNEIQTIAQRRLVDAKMFFRGKLQKKKDELVPSEFENFLIQFKQKIDQLQVIQYLVTSNSDAIRIFETANDRGKPLSNLEKTKSFLMHTSYLDLEDENIVEVRLNKLNDHFSRMYRHFEDVTETKDTKNIEWLGEDDIQRYHFINYVSPDSKKSALTQYMGELKNLIRNKLRRQSETDESAQYALDYAQDLAQAFLAMKDIVEMPGKGYDKQSRRTMHKIFLIGRLGNIFPILITSWIRFGKQPREMREILRLLEAFTFRAYAIAGRRSDTGVTRLNNLAHRLHRNGLDYAKLVSELKSLNHDYGSNQRLQNNLRSEDFYQNPRRDIKYLLSEYEIYLRGESKEKLTLAQEDILSPEYQVEHIWAQDTSKLGLTPEMKLKHEQNVHRLGNLTLAARSWNASMGNKPFEKKRDGDPPGTSPSYQNSVLRVQQDLAIHDIWNHETIRKREDEIVAFALQRWSI